MRKIASRIWAASRMEVFSYVPLRPSGKRAALQRRVESRSKLQRFSAGQKTSC
jgi:hypothetical protein